MGGTNYKFITIVSTFWQSFRKSNGRIKSNKAKSVVLDNLGLFGGILDLFWATGDALRVLPKKTFLQCTTPFENIFCHKISEKSNGRLSGNKSDVRD